ARHLGGSAEAVLRHSVGWQVVDAPAIEMHGARRRLDCAVVNVGERRLARAIRADKPDELRSFDVERHPLQHMKAAETLMNRTNLEPDHGAFSALVASPDPDAPARRFSTVSRSAVARWSRRSAVCTSPFRMKRSVSMSRSPKKTSRQTDMSTVTPA